MRHRVLPFLLTLAIGCGRGPAPQPFGSPMRPAPVDFDSALTWLDRRIGLPPLSGTMPDGHRELRVEIDCALCPPTHMLRMLADPAGRIRGEIWMESFHEPDSLDLALRRVIGCGPTRVIRDSADVVLEPEERDLYVICRGGMATDWRSVLAAIDASGLLELARTGGVEVSPVPLVEHLPNGTRILHDGGCSDLGSRYLRLRLLDRHGERSISFMCLESRSDTTAVHRRAVALDATLRGIVRPDRVRPARD